MKEIKDSGSRREFETGAVRDNGNTEEKGRFDLIPWEVIWDLAKHFAKGSAKYGDNNWQKGIPVDSYFDSATRHMIKHRLGHDDEDHLISAIWNLVAWCWEERYSPRARTKKLVEEIEELSNSVIEEINDGVKKEDDGVKWSNYGVNYGIERVCDECGEVSPTLFKAINGKSVCYKCWHKSEDDLK